MNQLPVFLTIAGAPVMLLGEGEAADAKRRLIERAGGLAVGEEGDARIAFVAIADDAEAEAAAARLKARGLLVNVVDRPALCDFTTPAIVDRDPLLIAVGTGGASAGLAKELRQRFEALLPASLGRLAEALAAARGTLRARFPDGGDRRRALDAALAPGGALDPLDPAAGDRVADWVAAPQSIPGELVTLWVASDDPDELTLRAARLLGRADRVHHDPGIAEPILARARADAVRSAGLPPADPGPGLTLWLRRAA